MIFTGTFYKTAMAVPLLVIVTSLSAQVHPLTKNVPPNFKADFGIVEQGDTLMLTITSKCGLKSASAEPNTGEGSWEGGLQGPCGSAVFTAIIPSSFSGTHRGRFSGCLCTCGSGGEAKGEPVCPTWGGESVAEVGEWVEHDPIQIGEVIKTSPTGPNSNNLHYAGTGCPEIAQFEIDASEATDIDRHTATGEERDAGLNEAMTDWKVPAGTGTILDGGFQNCLYSERSGSRQHNG